MDTNGMSIRTFQYLVALDETGHFGDAANRCDVTQSTLSLQVKRLEDYLGIELFDRSLRPVRTTQAGKDIIALAREAVGLCQQMKRVAAGYRRQTGTAPFEQPTDCQDFK
jgi:LysR family hydrogen peroxide-inducible transcriptional activator